MPIKNVSENFIIFTLSGLYFFHIVEFMILMPLGPQLMRVLGIDPTQFSHLVAVYNFAATVSGLIGIFWMDRWDRKTILIVVNVLFALGTAVCFMTSNYISLLIARIVTGFFGGLIGALCMTIIGDLVPMERRAFAMSKLMSAFSLASIAGIPLGLGLATQFSWQAPFIFITAGSILFCALAYFKMPNLVQHMNRAKQTSMDDVIEILTDTKFMKCFFFMSLMMISQFVIIPFISTSLVANGGMTEAQLPWIYLIGGFVTVFSNPIAGKLSDRYSKTLVFRICAILAWIPMILLTQFQLPSFALCVFVTTLFFVFNSGRMSPAMAIITSMVAPEKRGRFMSLNSAVQQSSAGLAAWVGGFLVSGGTNTALTGFQYNGYIAVIAGILSVFWVGRLRV